jgi:single-stranded DNA-binding protein
LTAGLLPLGLHRAVSDGTDTKGERKMTSKATITLYGNVGADPETHTIPGKQVRKEVYDPIIDDVVEREFTTLDRQVRTFSIAVSAKKDEDSEAVTRWIRCDDWKGLSKLVATGDRVRVKGYFKFRRYEKDGVTKTARTFVVEDLKVERLKAHRTAE